MSNTPTDKESAAAAQAVEKGPAHTLAYQVQPGRNCTCRAARPPAMICKGCSAVFTVCFAPGCDKNVMMTKCPACARPIFE